MILFANAKTNLGLFILSKREDGYHSISSLKFPIPLYDVLEFLPSEQFDLQVLGAKIEGATTDNLIYKAYALLQKNHDIGGVRVIVQKNIPAGAGLGGGSADATFTLKGLNDFFGLQLSSESLKSYAAHLGSDCPFFVDNVPQLASGKGDQLKPFDLDLKGTFLYLIHPDIHVSTAEAYARVVPKETNFEWEKLTQLDFEFWRSFLVNDFEKSVFERHPLIGELKDEMYAAGAVYASMSGSGSSVFGIFREKPSSFRPELKKQFILEL